MRETLEQAVHFPCGAVMKNKFMLAPMTNTQSQENGCISKEEHQWLCMRAKGDFGLVMTCASHVQQIGKGFPGQLGIFSDRHIPGHQKMTKEIKSYGSLAVIQLHHAGMRTPSKLINESPVCPSENNEYEARELNLEEVIQLKDDFISAAVRAKQCGYDGVEVHGAHGYIITQFLSPEINQRTDQYGGNLENRSRLLFEIVDGIRNACGAKFLLGVRLSTEKFGINLTEVISVCNRLIKEKQIDFLDISLWDVFKFPEEEAFKHKSLLNHFSELISDKIQITVAGKIRNGNDVKSVLDAGIDFVAIGRSAILHHDFPQKVMENIAFEAEETPVSREYLAKEGLGEKFIDYMSRWDGFVKQ